MDLALLQKIDEFSWILPQQGSMRVPGIIYGSEFLINQMDHKVFEQVRNVASLPGIVGASYAMPDAHWGYGFPIGGVAAFDPAEGGVISAGGVGFDISCGVRLLKTGILVEELEKNKIKLADLLFQEIPAGVGSQSQIRLNIEEMDEMLKGGARWAIERGFGNFEDLAFIEENGSMENAVPSEVSLQAKKRQASEMGTLGSGNHYFEVQVVDEVFNQSAAYAFGLRPGEIVISIHCGSRGLGHQIGTEFLRTMYIDTEKFGLNIPDRELACAPILSQTGQSYIGAMRSAMNCAFANRQILTFFARKAFETIFPHNELKLIYDVSHNTCKEERQTIHAQERKLFVHRKGATRSLGPGAGGLPREYQEVGQPVLIGGNMGVGSFVLVGTEQANRKSLSSSCHGAGRSMSRHQASRTWKAESLIKNLEVEGVLIRTHSLRGIAEEAPGAYKDLRQVVDAAEGAQLSKKVAYLRPLICVKG